MSNRTLFTALFPLFLLYWPLQPVMASGVISTDGAIESVKVGDPSGKVTATFNSKYRIIDETMPHHARTITLSRNSKTIATFSIDSESRVFFIDIRGEYRTVENVGVGSTLNDAKRAYGKGIVTPTDQGYLVTFKKQKNISFLLHNEDIPKDVRNIPDDVFTQDDEKLILNIGKARIIAIQISGA